MKKKKTTSIRGITKPIPCVRGPGSEAPSQPESLGRSGKRGDGGREQRHVGSAGARRLPLGLPGFQGSTRKGNFGMGGKKKNK